MRATILVTERNADSFMVLVTGAIAHLRSRGNINPDLDDVIALLRELKLMAPVSTEEGTVAANAAYSAFQSAVVRQIDGELAKISWG
ncbi:MAG: hypothetical protein OXH60_03475 [Rhodospirillales bacterium]|nr:hypothetical protein [Rhodospirillales bacterium]